MRRPGRIADLRRLTHDTFEVVVRCEPGGRPLLARAGQFATLAVDGVDGPRPYSFARDPVAEPPDQHTFLIRLVPGGAFSGWLAAADRTGASVTIAGPLGEFALDRSSAPMALIAGGSGMSAVRAIAEQACREQVARDCWFYYGARTADDLYGEDAMKELAESWHSEYRFEFVPVLSEEPGDSPWRGARGLVTDRFRTDLLDTGRLAPGNFRAWFCGPPPMIEAGAAALAAAGVPAAHVYRDVFEDARSPAPAIDNRRCVLCDECLLVRPVDRCIVEAGATAVAADGRLTAERPVEPSRSAGLYYNALVIDPDACIRCYACVSACPHGAISPEFRGAQAVLRRPSHAR